MQDNEYLNFEGLDISEIDFLEKIEHFLLADLARLSLHRNNITDFSVLSSLQLPNIKNLYLGSNKSHIFPLLKLKSLMYLYIFDNKICDIQNIVNCDFTNIRHINIEGNPIIDYKPLLEATLPNVKKFTNL